jgi:Skp family chaperone for outer membrane proteins
MTYASRIAHTIAGAILFAALGQATLADPPPQGAPVGKILVVDRNAVLSHSNVGQGIMKQVQGMADQARAGLKAREDALRKEYAQLQQQLPILAAGVKAAKVKAFEAKQTALQNDIQKQQLLIQGGLYNAREQVIAALKPVLHKIMLERGANLIVDRATLADAAPQLDITGLAIQRLNQALPSVKVTPQMPPQQPGQ